MRKIKPAKMGKIKSALTHPKDKRVDLLRFSISMVTDQKEIPLFVRALDGNSSYKKSLIKTIKELI